MSVSIDLNADLGEFSTSELDEQIMPFLSSCNIACGGHVGDEETVKRTIQLAIQHGVAIGAHPSFPDKENFGRKVIQINPSELRDSINNQILLVDRITKEEGVQLHHVKPHGALYNHAVTDVPTARLICEVVKGLDENLSLYGLSQSGIAEIAEEFGVPFIAEAFADRRYEPDGTLRSRSFDDAVITDKKEILRQVEELVFQNRVMANDWIPIQSQTICLHSDTPGAVTLAKEIHNHLVNKGAHITAV